MSNKKIGNFLKDSQTNWKYILIIIILASFAIGGILIYQQWIRKEIIKISEVKIPPIEKEMKEELPKEEIPAKEEKEEEPLEAILTPKTIPAETALDMLGVTFQYPTSWGEIQAKEIVALNYLFPSHPPDELIAEFKRRKLGDDFIAQFKKWSREKQLEYLIKDRIGYDEFLSKELIISFSKNKNVEIIAFNKNYTDFSGYECAVPILPIYRGNLVLNRNACFSLELFSQIKIENFYATDCRLLPNNLLFIPGTFDDFCFGGLAKENSYLIAVANLKKSKEYTGMVIKYFYKTYENPGAVLMSFFGYSGYVPEKEEIKEVNISACNAVGSSSPSTETFSKYFGRIIDDVLIQDFVSFISSELERRGISPEIKSLVVRKFQEELTKNKGKKFIDYRDEKNFNLYFDATGEIIEKINSYEDIERYFSQMNPNDVNCAVYKIEKKRNLDTFRNDVKNNPQLLEFQAFVKSITIK